MTREGRKVSDEEIKEYLTELVCGEGFPYGYRKLTVCLREDYGLIINHKKVYRLCKELDILLPQRKVKREKPRVLAKREEVTGPNQLWEMDVKYGYIPGTDQFFFQLWVATPDVGFHGFWKLPEDCPLVANPAKKIYVYVPGYHFVVFIPFCGFHSKSNYQGIVKKRNSFA